MGNLPFFYLAIFLSFSLILWVNIILLIKGWGSAALFIYLVIFLVSEMKYRILCKELDLLLL